MKLEIKSNADEIATKLGATAKEVHTAARKATRVATRVIYDEDRRQINEGIYAKKSLIPKIKRGPNKGKPKWKQTNRLRRGESMEFPDPLMGIIANDTPYAQPRHDMDRIGRDGVDRRAPWRKRTWEIVQTTAVQAFDAAFTKEMKL